jgi:hypothetical protein
VNVVAVERIFSRVFLEISARNVCVQQRRQGRGGIILEKLKLFNNKAVSPRTQLVCA